MAFGPLRPSSPHDAVTKEEPTEPITGAGEILDHVTAGATQVAHAFLGGRRDGDGGELTGAMQPGQTSGVAAVGLDPVARALGDQGGGQDLLGLAQPFDQAPDRVSVVEDLVDFGGVAIGREHRHRDRVL